MKKTEIRSQRWTKRICLKEEQYEFIKEELIKKKYKTLAGTLDFIINKYKNYGEHDKRTTRTREGATE